MSALVAIEVREKLDSLRLLLRCDVTSKVDSWLGATACLSSAHAMGVVSRQRCVGTRMAGYARSAQCVPLR